MRRRSQPRRLGAPSWPARNAYEGPDVPSRHRTAYLRKRRAPMWVRLTRWGRSSTSSGARATTPEQRRWRAAHTRPELDLEVGVEVEERHPKAARCLLPHGIA
jgi:hypothetical protein